MFIVGITGLSADSWAPPDVVISAVEAIGLSVENWPLATVMTFLITLVLAYTCLGGMVSVVIADYVQFVVLSLGLLLTCFLAVESLGWTNIFDSVDEYMVVPDSTETQTTTADEKMIKKGFDPTIAEGDFGWEYIIWMGFLGLVSCGIWPTSVARALAMDSPQAVKRQYMFGSISYLIRFLIPCFWGICAYVFIMQDESLKQLFFPAGYPAPDPLPEGVEAMDNLYGMPVFLGRILPMGIIGIISAGMMAAFMSTHDSYLLCWSSVLTQDVVAPICKSFGRDLKPKTRITLSRVFIVLVGLWCLYWGLLYKGEDDIWDYMAVTGAIYFTGAFALLLGGLYWKRASSGGAFLALLVGSMAVLGLSPVQDFLGIEIASAWVGLISIGATLAAMIVGSICFPDRRTPTTPAERMVMGPSVLLAGVLAIVAIGALVIVAIFGAWRPLWMVVLIVGVLLFAALAVFVSFGGFFDVVKLIKRCREGQEPEDPLEPEDGSR